MFNLTDCSRLLSYDREIQSKESDVVGFRITVQVDPNNSCKPLQATHSPLLSSAESAEADRAIKCDHLSIEKLLVQTIYIRTKQKLNELKDHIQKNLSEMECERNFRVRGSKAGRVVIGCIFHAGSVSGSPAVLQVAILQPCLRAEQLLISIDTHTGIFLAHIPKYGISSPACQVHVPCPDVPPDSSFSPCFQKSLLWMIFSKC